MPKQSGIFALIRYTNKEELQKKNRLGNVRKQKLLEISPLFRTLLQVAQFVLIGPLTLASAQEKHN